VPIKTEDQNDTSPKSQEDFVRKWMRNIEDALKREKKYRTCGQKVVDIYEGKCADETPFNIIYSNTETLQPAVYNQRPVPIVTRRFKDADPIGKAVAEVETRMLKFLIDNEDEEYETFDELMQPAVLDSLLTNRGLTRFKYVAHENRDAYECVYGEAVRWDKFFHGYARTWKKVPWIGFEWDMTKEEIKANFKGIEIDFRDMEVFQDGEDGEKRAEDRDELAGVVTYKVYEIWDKRTKKVMFFSGCARKTPLRMVNDPLGLSGFFPVPKPLNFMRKVTTLIPTPLYEQYRQQAQELNDLTRRLKAIIKAVRYRGAYNSTVEGIEKMLMAEDNELVPVENMASMPENTTIDRLLYTVPVQELVQTAQSLYQQRESCKQVIYEITGISDILRGASVASETATAQNIKNQWGTLRLKKMQKEVQRYCREALAIVAEIASAKFEQKTVQQMTGLPYFTNEQKQLIQTQIQVATQQAAMMAQPGQPPQKPPIPPEIEALLKLPSWEDIMSLMQNDLVRNYKIDIETNSTIDAEAAQDKQDIADLLNALSQMMNAFGPMVADGTMPFAVAKEILLVISRRYNFGSNLEDILNSIEEPQGKGEDPAAQMDLELKKMEIEAKKAENQQKAQLSQMEFGQKKALAELEMQIEREQLEIKRQELAMQREGMAMKMEAQRQAHQQKMQQMAVNAATKAKEPSNAAV
jgi:hypothetical protein